MLRPSEGTKLPKAEPGSEPQRRVWWGSLLETLASTVSEQNLDPSY